MRRPDCAATAARKALIEFVECRQNEIARRLEYFAGMFDDVVGNDGARLAQHRNAVLDIAEHEFAIADEIGGQHDKVEGKAVARPAGLIAWFEFVNIRGHAVSGLLKHNIGQYWIDIAEGAASVAVLKI